MTEPALLERGAAAAARDFASTATGPVMVHISNLHKSYGRTEVLKGIDLTVHRGEVVTIIGPSGSGKSTLLSCINFLETFDAGEITIDGQPIGWISTGHARVRMAERQLNLMRQRIGIVFQQFNLFPHMTVLQNVIEAPIQVKGIAREQAVATAREQLDRVGLRAKENAYPSELSGGQQQRVAIARSLAMDPKVMLLDEITSALDPELAGEVLSATRALAEAGMTMIIVTHEMAFAREVSDHVVFMDDGSIVEEGPPDALLTSPRQERTRSFLRRVIERAEKFTTDNGQE
jgi:polar amino acid transport system ATP-binding protein